MIRFSLPMAVAAVPAFAHGLHAPVAPSWHGAAHLTVATVLVAIAAVAGVALMRRSRRASAGRLRRDL